MRIIGEIAVEAELQHPHTRHLMFFDKGFNIGVISPRSSAIIDCGENRLNSLLKKCS